MIAVLLRLVIFSAALAAAGCSTSRSCDSVDAQNLVLKAFNDDLSRQLRENSLFWERAFLYQEFEGNVGAEWVRLAEKYLGSYGREIVHHASGKTSACADDFYQNFPDIDCKMVDAATLKAVVALEEYKASQKAALDKSAMAATERMHVELSNYIPMGEIMEANTCRADIVVGYPDASSPKLREIRFRASYVLRQNTNGALNAEVTIDD